MLAAVEGEEQGLYGSTFMAAQMAAAGNDVQGMFSNDIVGKAAIPSTATQPDPHTPADVPGGHPDRRDPRTTSALMQSVGGENDGLSRQLARFVSEVAPFSLTNMNIRLIWRRDRYLRGSDHLLFQGQGYAAARFTEPRENFDHEHRNVQVINGVQFGDLIDFVDFDYTARVAAVNGAALWALAHEPEHAQERADPRDPAARLRRNNITNLTWNANPESNIAGYEVVTRETTVPDWTETIPVGNVTSVMLDIAKDNVQFGVRAVDSNGNRSPVGFPTTTTS